MGDLLQLRFLDVSENLLGPSPGAVPGTCEVQKVQRCYILMCLFVGSRQFKVYTILYTKCVFLCWFSVFHAISRCFQNFETLKDDTNIININDMNMASKRGLNCAEFRVNDTLRRHFYRTHGGSQVLAICLALGYMKAGWRRRDW